MKCIHFGSCGSCSNYEQEYSSALEAKKVKMYESYKEFNIDAIEVFESPTNAHRARAEFKIWQDGDRCFYAMTNLTKDGIVKIDECPKLIEPVANIQYKLLDLINKNILLRQKLFTIEFLGSLEGDVLITLIYHKKVTPQLIDEAKRLEQILNVKVILRARKQKEVISKDYIESKLYINSSEFKYIYYDTGFTQPNPYINEKMISWAVGIAKNIEGDLLEAYCGLGNFTIPLSREFNKVLATEVSKTSIKNAKINCDLNEVDNIEFIRLNASETAQALRGDREFNRLRDVDLSIYNFSTILVDPPRAGLDKDSLELAQSIDNIIYISCNPETLVRDLKELTKTHKIKKVAIFDQFPYTTHIENGVYLERV